MSKGILEFSLPDEQLEFDTACRAEAYRAAVVELDEWLRQQIKYQDKADYQPVRDALRKIAEEQGLELW